MVSEGSSFSSWRSAKRYTLSAPGCGGNIIQTENALSRCAAATANRTAGPGLHVQNDASASHTRFTSWVSVGAGDHGISGLRPHPARSSAGLRRRCAPRERALLRGDRPLLAGRARALLAVPVRSTPRAITGARPHHPNRPEHPVAVESAAWRLPTTSPGPQPPVLRALADFEAPRRATARLASSWRCRRVHRGAFSRRWKRASCRPRQPRGSSCIAVKVLQPCMTRVPHLEDQNLCG